MKLKAYSQNNPIKHLILHTVKRFLWLPAVITILSVLVFILPEVTAADKMLASSLKFDPDITFIFKTEDLWEFYPYFLIFVSVISAYVMFSFLFNKKRSTMMMLTGVSRSMLFATRYVYGLVSLLAPVTIVFTVLLCIGITNAGKGLAIPENMCMILLMVAVTVIYTYTVSVIAASLCGRKTEFFVICTVFIFGAQALLCFAAIILASFLQGFAYPLRDNSSLPYTFKDIFGEYSYISINTIFKTAFSDYLSSGRTTEEPIRLGVYYDELILLAATTIILIFTAVFVFKRRRSEYDGKANANRTLSAVCAVIISLFASSFMLLLGNTLTVFIGLLAVFAVLCAISHSFFDGTAKQMLRSVRYSLPTAAVIAVFALVAYTDVFGYSTAVPDIDDIASVRVTYKGEPDLFIGKSTAGYTENITATTVHFEKFPEFTSKSDIETAIDIHKLLISDGSRRVSNKNGANYSDTVAYADYYIVYTLKDGSEMIRCYPQLKLSTLYETLIIEETDAYSELLSRRIKNHYDVFYDSDLGSGGTIGLSDNMLSKCTYPSLTNEEKQELVNVLSEDKANSSFEQKYHPEQECVGVIWLSTNRNAESKFPKAPVYVYEWDVKTLKWLEEKGLNTIFNAEYTVKDVTVYELDYYISDYMRKEAIDRYFSSSFNSDTYANSPFSPSAKAVEEADFDSLLEKCRLSYFTDGNNKFAVITLINSDGEEVKTVKFVTE